MGLAGASYSFVFDTMKWNSTHRKGAAHDEPLTGSKFHCSSLRTNNDNSVLLRYRVAQPLARPRLSSLRDGMLYIDRMARFCLNDSVSFQ